VALAKRTGAKVVCNFDLAQHLEREGVSTQGLYFAGRTKMPFGWVKWSPPGTDRGFSRGNERVYGGVACGFCWRWGRPDLPRGDTGLTVAMQLLGEEKVDLALLPIGGTTSWTGRTPPGRCA
jgi:L-ascorbate metabolism protein UlaG (beta-lactamase superfamily)